MTDLLTRLDEIEKRCAMATNGPWQVYSRVGSSYSSIISPAGDAELGNWMVAERVQWNVDAAFIAAARTDVPWLIDMVIKTASTIRALQTDRDRWIERETIYKSQIEAGAKRIEMVEAERDALQRQIEALQGEGGAPRTVNRTSIVTD